MTYDAKEHWENIYQTKEPNEVSWHQEKPTTSLRLITETNLDKNARIIDVGAGDSMLVDNLLALGFRNITVLDVSSMALNRAKKRLRDKANSVKWIESDLRKFETNDRYDIWHDRAVLHFLTKEEDISRYVERVRQLLKPNGYPPSQKTTAMAVVSSLSLRDRERASSTGMPAVFACET